MKNAVSLEKLEQLARQFDDGALSYVELRKAEREIEIEESSATQERWILYSAIALLIGLAALGYAFMPRYSIVPSAAAQGAYVINTSTGDVYRCYGHPFSSVTEPPTNIRFAMKCKNIAIMLGIISSLAWYYAQFLESERLAEEAHRQQLAYSELSDEVVKNITLAVDKELSSKIDVSAHGIAISGGYDLGDRIIVSKNTPYTITCDDSGVITVAFGIGEEAPIFWLESYREGLPFLPTSIAGKKLTGLLCEHVVASLHATIFNNMNADISLER
jgi:hypothetical protein